MAAPADVIERTSEPPHLRLSHARELLAYREILMNLVRKELKVKYAASVLGAVWSLLNPVVFLAVFTFVTTVLRTNIPNYPVYLLAGLLPWNLFSVSLSNGAHSVIDNGNLVKKVYFPREVLPLAAIGVALVDFVLQSAVLLLFLVVIGYDFHPSALALYPLSFVTLLVFTIAISFWVSAVNVRYRDIQHLIGLGLLVWFWVTPIVYPGGLVQQELASRSFLGMELWAPYLLNPLAGVIFGFQRALYGTVAPAGEAVLPDVSVAWLAGVIAAVLVVSLVVLWLTWRLFFRLSGDFAEEL
jgi:ABC-2 type transport system permease protein